MPDGARLAIRVDGNRHIGLGHVFRCRHLARALERAHGIESEFLVLESSLAGQVGRFLQQDPFPVRVVSRSDDPWQQDDGRLATVLAEGGYATTLVDLLAPDPEDTDLRNNPEFIPPPIPETLALCHRVGLPVIAFSDQATPMSLDADLVVNTCPAQDPVWYADERGRRYSLGPDWYIMADEFRPYLGRRKTFRHSRPKVVAFFGGNDHRGFTEPAVAAISSLQTPLSLEVVVGAATPDGDAVADRLRQAGVPAHHGVPDLGSILFDADLLVTTSGNTLFDLAALGVPAVALSTRPRQRITARYFADQGSCVDLNVNQPDPWSQLARTVDALITAPPVLARMSAAGRATVDGGGTERLSKEILRCMKARRQT